MVDFLFDKEILAGTVGGLRYERENKSENYVTIPPAFLITDADGGMWSFGPEYIKHGWIFEFNVLRNDVDTGEVAYKIEYQKGVVTIYGVNGKKRWSSKSFI
jgi:hypothetical protein